MLILLELDLHVSDFLVLVHGLFVKLVGGFLVLLQFALLDSNRPFHGLEADALLVKLGLVLPLFGTQLFVQLLALAGFGLVVIGDFLNL